MSFTNTSAISALANEPSPVVVEVSSSSTDRTYLAGETLTLTVRFNQPVMVDTTGGSPTLRLETGTTDRIATYAGGSGTTTLTFHYTVQTNDRNADLDYADTASLAANGAALTNAAGSEADLTLASPGEPGSLSASKQIDIFGVVSNEPPVLSDIPPLVYTDTPGPDVFPPVMGTAQAVDPDNGPQPLTFSLYDPDMAHPAIPGPWTEGVLSMTGTYGTLSIDPVTGVWTYEPDQQAMNAAAPSQTTTALQDRFSVRVSDGVSLVPTLLTVTVVPGDDRPAADASSSSGTLVEDSGILSVSHQLQFVDVDGDASGDLMPTIQSTSVAGAYGHFQINAQGTWTYTVDPALLQPLKASQTATEVFQVRVDDMNVPVTLTLQGSNDPVVATRSSLSAAAGTGSAVHYTLPDGLFTDADGEAVTLSLHNAEGGAAPSWLSFSPQTRTLSGTAPAGTGSELRLLVKGHSSDTTQASIALTLTLDTSASNTAPRFATDALTLDLPENSTSVARLAATDAEGDALSYSLAGGSDAPLFLIDATTGELRFKQAPDHEQPADSNSDNRYELRVQATDGRGGQAEQQVHVQVTDIDETSPPIGTETDQDGDGATDLEEQGVPNTATGTERGDGNGDGIPDAQQPNVASLLVPHPLLTHYLTADSTASSVAVTMSLDGDGAAQPSFPGVSPYGPVSIHLTRIGATGTQQALGTASAQELFGVSLYLDSRIPANGFYVRDGQGQWHNIAQEIKTDPATGKTLIHLSLPDGSLWDQDGAANGEVRLTGVPGLLEEDALIPTREVSRFYHAGQAKHFFTPEVAERAALAAPGTGWTDEGAPFSAPTDGSGEAVWRFFNPSTGDHFYTLETHERDVLKQPDSGYLFEGEAWRAYRQDLYDGEQNTVALHRFFNASTGNHFYTTSEPEKLALLGAGDYAYEGVMGYVFE